MGILSLSISLIGFLAASLHLIALTRADEQRYFVLTRHLLAVAGTPSSASVLTRSGVSREVALRIGVGYLAATGLMLGAALVPLGERNTAGLCLIGLLAGLSFSVALLCLLRYAFPAHTTTRDPAIDDQIKRLLFAAQRHGAPYTDCALYCAMRHLDPAHFTGEQQI